MAHCSAGFANLNSPPGTACASGRSLRNAQELVGLQAQAPLRVLKTVAQGELCIPGTCWVIQGLQEKMAEIEILEALWLSPCLWENQLELVSGA